jgi:hypothetical protein
MLVILFGGEWRKKALYLKVRDQKKISFLQQPFDMGDFLFFFFLKPFQHIYKAVFVEVLFEWIEVVFKSSLGLQQVSRIGRFSIVR